MHESGNHSPGPVGFYIRHMTMAYRPRLPSPFAASRIGLAADAQSRYRHTSLSPASPVSSIVLVPQYWIDVGSPRTPLTGTVRCSPSTMFTVPSTHQPYAKPCEPIGKEYPTLNAGPNLHANSSECSVLLCAGAFEKHVVQCRLRVPHRLVDACDLLMITLHVLQASSELLDERRELGIRRIHH